MTHYGHRKSGMHGYSKTVNISSDMLAELRVEARRLDRSVSWVIHRCIRRALKEVQALPTIREPREREAAE